MNKWSSQELDSASDFGQRQFVKFPYIKFVSAEGKNPTPVKNFALLRSDENGKLQAEELGEEIKVVFLKRGKFKLKKGTYTTNEIMAGKDKEISVYQINKQTNRRSFKDKGEWQAMKERYGLSTYQYPYVLFNGEVMKLGILPSSLNVYWEFVNQFKGEDRVYHYETIVKAAQEPKDSQAGGSYYEMTFKQGKKLSEEEFGKVAIKILELKEILGNQEKRREELANNEKGVEELKKEFERAETEEEMPTINEGDI